MSARGGRGGRERVRRSGHVYGISLLYAFCVLVCGTLVVNGGPAGSDSLRVGFAVAAVPFVIAIVRTLPIGVYIEPNGVLIRNVLASRRLAWTEIERFELGQWRGWGNFACGVARLVDGGQVTIYALNPPALGEDEILPLIDDLNARLGQATGRSFPPATLG